MTYMYICLYMYFYIPGSPNATESLPGRRRKAKVLHLVQPLCQSQARMRTRLEKGRADVLSMSLHTSYQGVARQILLGSVKRCQDHTRHRAEMSMAHVSVGSIIGDVQHSGLMSVVSI